LAAQAAADAQGKEGDREGEKEEREPDRLVLTTEDVAEALAEVSVGSQLAWADSSPALGWSVGVRPCAAMGRGPACAPWACLCTVGLPVHRGPACAPCGG